MQSIPTPALVLDLNALERNIRRMADFFADGPCRLRPHVKAHKTPAIARRQLAAGSCTGLTCATLGEAEAVVAFCDDLLIANEIVQAGKCDRVAALARRLRDRTGREAAVTLAVDSLDGLHAIAAAARRASVLVGLLVDVNVGQNRCGVAPGDAAVALARQVVRTEGVMLRGVMGYEGHVQPIRARAERERAARSAMTRLVETAGALRHAGLPCGIVSAGGTGTYDISGRVPGITEIQAGSYALMDTDYRETGVPFEQAFRVRGTVISRPAADRCVADCGHKAVTRDHGMPAVHAIDGASVTALNDEHAVIALPPHATIAIGDPVELVPSHIDPTINLHDAFYVLEGLHLVDVWPIAARGYPEQRGAGLGDAATAGAETRGPGDG